MLLYVSLVMAFQGIYFRKSWYIISYIKTVNYNSIGKYRYIEFGFTSTGDWKEKFEKRNWEISKREKSFQNKNIRNKKRVEFSIQVYCLSQIGFFDAGFLDYFDSMNFLY